jgi:hypothetical protein
MDLPRTTALEAARNMLGLPLAQLWLDYIGLGGNLPPTVIGAALSGRVGLGDYDHDMLVQALNERFIDRAQNHPLAYADELPPAS